MKNTVVELKSRVLELLPFRDGYDPSEYLPEEGRNVVAVARVFKYPYCYRIGNNWYDSLLGGKLIEEPIRRWWFIPDTSIVSEQIIKVQK